MVLAEFLLIAFVVGVVTKTWLGFVGTLAALLALYRFTRLAPLLSFALSLYWGLLGYHLGAATGQFLAAPVLAAVAFVIALGVHRDGLSAPAMHRRAVASTPPAEQDAPDPRHSDARRPRSRVPQGEIIDAEYRVVS